MINILTYAICKRFLAWNTIISNSVSWIASVTFAYITNRRFVFESKVSGFKEIVREFVSFFTCRIITGLLDLVIMYVFVDLIGANDLIMKIESNMIVIILNYIASKLFIFTNQKKQK